MSNAHDRPIWEEGWDGHEAQQRERLSRLPLTEKLRWLEGAHHLAVHLSSAATVPASPAAEHRHGRKSS